MYKWKEKKEGCQGQTRRPKRRQLNRKNEENVKKRRQHKIKAAKGSHHN